MDLPECPCERCNPPTPLFRRFTMCPVCGNKRCPKGTDHKLDCTNSNEPGQRGSSWEDVKPIPVAIYFPQPCKRLSMNDRHHWARKAELTRTWRQAVALHARTIGRFPPATVHVTFPVRDNRRRDPHNTAPTVKAIVDGLVDAGVWPDDTDEYVVVMDPKFSKDSPDVIVELRARDWGLT